MITQNIIKCIDDMKTKYLQSEIKFRDKKWQKFEVQDWRTPPSCVYNEKDDIYNKKLGFQCRQVGQVHSIALGL